MWWEQGFGLSLCPSPCLLPPLRFGKQGSATNPGHGHCSAPRTMAMPGALPACSPPLPAHPPAFCAGKSGCPFNHFRSAFFCSTSGQRLALLSGLHLAGQRLHCASARCLASARKLGLCKARPGKARPSVPQKKPRSIPAPQPLPAVLRLACCLRYASASKARPVPGGTPPNHTLRFRAYSVVGGVYWKALACFRTVLATLRAERPQRPGLWP